MSLIIWEELTILITAEKGALQSRSGLLEFYGSSVVAKNSKSTVQVLVGNNMRMRS